MVSFIEPICIHVKTMIGLLKRYHRIGRILFANKTPRLPTLVFQSISGISSRCSFNSLKLVYLPPLPRLIRIRYPDLFSTIFLD